MLTVKQAADQLEVSTGRVRQLLTRGIMTGEKFADVWRISQAEVTRYASTRQQVGWKKGRPRK